MLAFVVLMITFEVEKMNITIIAILHFSTERLGEISWLVKLVLAMNGGTNILTPDLVPSPGTYSVARPMLCTMSYQHTKVGRAEK